MNLLSTNKGMKKLISEATPPPSADHNAHDLLTDAGLEFSRVELAMPSDSWVVRTKDPFDRQGIASLDKAIQTFKVTLEDLVTGQPIYRRLWMPTTDHTTVQS
jgi:hypothetical protein